MDAPLCFRSAHSSLESARDRANSTAFQTSANQTLALMRDPSSCPDKYRISIDEVISARLWIAFVLAILFTEGRGTVIRTLNLRRLVLVCQIYVTLTIMHGSVGALSTESRVELLAGGLIILFVFARSAFIDGLLWESRGLAAKRFERIVVHGDKPELCTLCLAPIVDEDALKAQCGHSYHAARCADRVAAFGVCVEISCRRRV